VFLPFASQWSALYAEVVSLHLVAGRVYSEGMGANLSAILHDGQEYPLELAAAAVSAVALLRRCWAVLPPALWAIASFVLLLHQQPLWVHHMALLVPPLVLTAAAGLHALRDMAGEVLARPRVRAAGFAAPSISAAWMLVGVVALAGLALGYQSTRAVATPSRSEVALAIMLESATRPGDLVIADDQYAVGLADRDVPAQLVDTSFVRIRSSDLTATRLEAIAQEPDVQAVLFATGRLDLVPGFRSWVGTHFLLAGTLGDGMVLYLKQPPGPTIV
jgi:hypothetical protein